MTSVSGNLKIELFSDLCSGSGLSYAGVIDSDIVYDEWGFPYIPARRIKGCLREAAEMIGLRKHTIELKEVAEEAGETNMLEYLFGRRGDKAPGHLIIGNATLKYAEELKSELDSVSGIEDLKKVLTPDNILKMYTSVRAQTSIDKDTKSAKDNTLRFTRVVNQFEPIGENKGGPLCFYAPISMEVELDKESDSMENLENDLQDTALATRNIGLNRNRGFGSVRCEIVDIIKFQKDSECEERDNAGERNTEIRPGDEKEVKIEYVIENTAPLVLSEDDSSSTESFISGKSILGALAGAYIRRNGKDSVNDEEFRDLFLNGSVKYANAYPEFEEIRTYPAPFYLNKLKKTKKIVNKFCEPETNAEKGDEEKQKIEKPESNQYDESGGNQPKLMKTQYVAEKIEADNNMVKIRYEITEPEEEIAFHHRRDHRDSEASKSDDICEKINNENTQSEQDKAKQDELEPLLYSLEFLKEGQRFAGEIYTKKKYENVIKELLNSSNLRFGKSRAAQYGSCKIVSFSSSEAENQVQNFKEDCKVVVTLKSDGIFMDENGCYTVCFSEVKDVLAKDLGLDYKDVDEEKIEGPIENAIQTKEVVGYNTTWNMKRPAVPAVKAGSAFVYMLSKDQIVISGGFVGERNQEGFGEVEVLPLDKMEYKVEGFLGKTDKDEANDEFTQQSKQNKEISESVKEILRIVSKDMLLDSIMLKSLEDSRDGKKYSLNSSNIGRITLMLKESLGNHPDDPDRAKRDFLKRIKSIKKDKIEREAENLFNDSEILRGKLKNSDIEGVLKLLEPDKDDKQEFSLLKEIWGEYMLQYMTQLKYES